MLVGIVDELPVGTPLEQIGVVADALLKGCREAFGGLQDVGADGSGELGRGFGGDVDVRNFDGFVVVVVNGFINAG